MVVFSRRSYRAAVRSIPSDSLLGRRLDRDIIHSNTHGGSCQRLRPAVQLSDPVPLVAIARSSRGPLTHGDAEQLPFTGDASQVGRPEGGEGEIRARGQIPDRARDHHLVIPCFSQHA
jgi:hypothetical protein